MVNLSANSSAISLLEENKDKIFWIYFSKNPAIFELDYEALKKRCAIFKEELIQKVMHPSRIQYYLNEGYDLDEIFTFF